jgi:hypothetical protein
VSPLNESDFVVDEAYSMYGYTNMATALHRLNTDFCYYYYDSAVDASMEGIFESARGIHIGDHKIEVLLAYGNGKEGEMKTGSNFYEEIGSSLQTKVLTECDTYIYYSFGDYNMYFYFDGNDKVSFVVFSYDRNMTSVSFSAYGRY